MKEFVITYQVYFDVIADNEDEAREIALSVLDAAENADVVCIEEVKP